MAMAEEMLPEYTVEVLEDAPVRAAKFLQGLGAVPIARTQLAHAGMTDEDVDEGRTLLLACLAQPKAPAVDVDTDDARRQRAAIVELNAWDEPNFARFGAALRRRAPSVYEYIFGDLKASANPEQAVNGIATFLARVDGLDKGADPARTESRKDDKAAVALLEQRGLTKAERKRLRELVDVALGPTRPLEVLPTADADELRTQKLRRLRGWFDEWSETARAVVKKRAHLIRLGLATRRADRTTDDAEDETEKPADGATQRPAPTP